MDFLEIFLSDIFNILVFNIIGYFCFLFIVFFFSTIINSQETNILFEGMLIIVKSYQSPGSRESIRYILGHILPLNSTPVITFVTMYDTTN